MKRPILILKLFWTATVLAQTTVNLPSGQGWKPLTSAGTMISVGPGTIANGMYADNTFTSTTSYPFGPCDACTDSYMTQWTGGAADDVNKRMYIMGGGHNDLGGGGNEVFTLELTGRNPHWTLFTPPTFPLPPQQDGIDWEGVGGTEGLTFMRSFEFKPGPGRGLCHGVPSTYVSCQAYCTNFPTRCHNSSTNSAPAGRHTYGGLVYDPTQTKLWTMGGSLYSLGNGSTELWSLNIASKVWTMRSPFGGHPLGGVPDAAFNPTNRHILLFDQNTTTLTDFDNVANTSTVLTSDLDVGGTITPSISATDPTLVVDTLHNYLLMIGSGINDVGWPQSPVQNVVRQIDLSGADGYTTHKWDDPSCAPLYSWPGAAWDANLRLVVIYPGGGNKLIFLNPGPRDMASAVGLVPSHKCITLTLGRTKGTDYPTDPDISGSTLTNNGNYQRFSYFPSEDVFILANSTQHVPWMLRLHDNGVTVCPDLTLGPNCNGPALTNRPFSVPRFFAQGEIPNFAQAVDGGIFGTAITTQCDVKNRWPDGSVKFAIISFVLANVPTSGEHVVFVNQATGNNTGALTAAQIVSGAYNFDATIALTGTASRTLSARSILSNAGTNCATNVNCRYWLQGPVVTAVIIEDRAGRSFDTNIDNGVGNPLHPIYEAWCYTQTNQCEVGITLENIWTSSTAANDARDQTFSMILSTGNSPSTQQLTQPLFTQFAHTRWRRAYWIGTPPASIKIDFNWPYLATTKGYPIWDPNMIPNENALSNLYAEYTALPAANLLIPGTDTGCPSNCSGSIVNYQTSLNGGGAADWIGPADDWDIMYLETGDPRMQTMSQQNADLAGRFQMWFREADHSPNIGTGGWYDATTTGTVDGYGHGVSINARQQLALASYPSQCAGEGPDDPGNVRSTSNWQGQNNVQDTSHMPDFGYIPYTLTGKYYYYEQLQLQAHYHLAHNTACTTLTASRQGNLGLEFDYGRVLAWNLRTVNYAWFMAFDGSPARPYLLSKLQNNIAMLEGEHNLTMDVPSNAATTTSYNYGKTDDFAVYTSAPSPKGDFRSFDCNVGVNCYVSQCCDPNLVSQATAPWQTGFIVSSLGMMKQMGAIDTSALINFTAKRYVHLLLDPSITQGQYMIQDYIEPTVLVARPNTWIGDWNTVRDSLLPASRLTAWEDTRPNGTGCQQASGLVALSALSYMIGYSDAGFTAQNAWNYYKAVKPYQRECLQGISPEWGIVPYTQLPASVSGGAVRRLTSGPTSAVDIPRGFRFSESPNRRAGRLHGACRREEGCDSGKLVPAAASQEKSTPSSLSKS